MATDQRETLARSPRAGQFLAGLLMVALAGGLALFVAQGAGAQQLYSTPIAADDVSVTGEDTPVAIDVLANDSDTEPLTITQVTAPAHGVASTDGAMAIYTPTQDYNGADSFGYTVSDGLGGTASASVSVTVTAVNDAPLAGDGMVTTSEDEPVVIDLGSLVTDVETRIADLIYTITAGPEQGLLAGSGMTRTYTPTLGYAGADRLVYYVTDRGDPDNCGSPGPDCAAALSSLTATIDISVTAVNDPPVLGSIGDRAVDEGVTLVFTATASDPEAPPEVLTYSLLGAPLGASIDPASGAFAWTPTEAQGPGVYTFTVRVTDNGTPSLYDEEQVAVTVAEANLAPVLDPIGDNEAVEGVTLTFTATATDADLPANTLTFGLIGEPAGASIDPATGAFSWAPGEAQGALTYTFTVRVTDDGEPALSDEETIAVHVSPVNLAPVALDGEEEISEHAAVAIDLGALVSDAETADADLTYTIERGPAHGVLAGSGPVLVYTPTLHYNGSDDIVYYVTDRGDPDGCGDPGADCAAAMASVTRTVSITIYPVNDPPLASDGAVTTDEDTPTTIDLGALVSDVETADSALAYTVSSGPSHGVLTGSGAIRIYTPTADYYGSDAFVYYVTDRGDPDDCSAPPPGCTASLSSPTRTVTITVNAVNDAPVLASIGNRAVSEETPLTFTAVATDVEAPPEVLTYGLLSAPAGASIDPVNGAFDWTPTEVQGPGVYTFTVRVTDDGEGNLYDEEQIGVTVAEVNVAPVLSAIGNRAVMEGVTLAFTATATDSDLPANILTYTLLGAPSGASIDPATGAFSWTPGEAQGGMTHTFTVSVTDNGVPALSDGETIAVHVSPVNAPPVALDGGATTAEDTPAGIDLGALAGDAETANGDLTYTVVRGPLHGALGGSGPVRVYTPTRDYNGADSLVYSVTDRGDPDGCGTPGYDCAAALSSPTRTVSITVTPVNDPPVAADDVVTTNEDSAVVIYVLDNDVDVDGDMLTVYTGNAAHGTATTDGRTVTYTPSSNWHGQDTFGYSVSDGHGGWHEAAVTVNVLPVNDQPLAINGSAAGSEGAVMAIDLSALVTDVETADGNLVYAIVEAPAHGVLAGVGPSFTYTPAANYNGADSLSYYVTDRGDPDGCATPGDWCAAALSSVTRTVSITIYPVNDPPLASDGAVTTDEDLATTIDLGALVSDVETADSALAYIVSSGPSHGVLTGSGATRTYTPTHDYYGSDAFVYYVTDRGDPDDCSAPPPGCAASLSSPTRTVTITVNAVNDAPVLAAIGNRSVSEETPLTFTASATDVEAPPEALSYSLLGAPSGAEIGSTSGSFSWTPTEAQGPGVYTFTVRVTDDGLGNLHDDEQIQVTVAEVNVAPVLAAIGDRSVNEGVTLSFTATATDSDLPANTLTYSLLGAPSGASIGSTSGAFTWVAAEAQGPGVYVFTVRVTDDGEGNLYDEEQIGVTVAEVNVAPVLSAIGNRAAMEGVTLAFTVTATDSDLPANVLTYTLLGAPSGASIEPASGAFSWTPGEAQGGMTHTFTVSVTDNGVPALSDGETIAVHVSPVNAPPVALDGGATTAEDTPAGIDLGALAGDAETANGDLTYTVVRGPLHGALGGSGPVRVYTPTRDYNGADDLVYSVTDRGDPDECGTPGYDCAAALSSVTRTVAITITPVNDPPVALSTTVTTAEDIPVVIDFRPLVSDVETAAGLLAYTISSPPSHGLLADTVATRTYTPAANYHGEDSLTYYVTDRGDPDGCSGPYCAAALSSVTATVSLSVTSVNDSPVAADDWALADVGVPISIPVLANDSDVDGDPLAIAAVGSPRYGSAITLTDGITTVISYVSDVARQDVFTYTVTDGSAHATATVTVGVANRRYLPLAIHRCWCDPYEPNDGFAEAYGPLASGTVYEAMLCPGDPDDLYYIDLAAARDVTIDLTNIPAGTDYDLSLWYEDVPGHRTLVASSRSLGNASEHIAYPASWTGRYYVRVFPSSGRNDLQPYRLVVNY